MAMITRAASLSPERIVAPLMLGLPDALGLVAYFVVLAQAL